MLYNMLYTRGVFFTGSLSRNQAARHSVTVTVTTVRVPASLRSRLPAGVPVTPAVSPPGPAATWAGPPDCQSRAVTVQRRRELENFNSLATVRAPMPGLPGPAGGAGAAGHCVWQSDSESQSLTRNARLRLVTVTGSRRPTYYCDLHLSCNS
jgi:hypothetical protein